ncbi:MAG: hypothetical protein ABIV51_12505 [Saprospiraceae bacterium]
MKKPVSEMTYKQLRRELFVLQNKIEDARRGYTTTPITSKYKILATNADRYKKRFKEVDDQIDKMDKLMMVLTYDHLLFASTSYIKISLAAEDGHLICFVDGTKVELGL